MEGNGSNSGGRKFRFSIDRGGTFTDVFATCPSGATRVCKLLSKSEECYGDAPTEGIRRIIEMDTGRKLDRNERIDSSVIESIRMGTTVATNALLERKGERTGLLITRGFKDLLHIGNQARPGIFDLTVECPEQIYEEVVEVDERIVLVRQGEGELFGNGERKRRRSIGERVVDTGLAGGKKIVVLRELDEIAVEKELRGLWEKGFRAVAVVFLHSWVWEDHERKVEEVARKVGFKNVSLSCDVMRMVRAVPRGVTTVVDSYTTPLIKEYLESFKKGFTALEPNQVLFMQSDGGLTGMNRFCGSRAVLSGPAGGVVGYARTVFDRYEGVPVIGFDMGGTSTDVSRFDGEFVHCFENVTAGVPLQTAQLDIQTVAAGGGSVLTFRSGIYCVGPESAGANPGPVAYDQGGEELTITDANLVLNRLVPERFPKIFGKGHDSGLNVERTVKRFEEMRKEINKFNQEQYGMGNDVSLEEVALGFVKVANETMARPIRNITQGKGFDPSTHMLACFGGAGGQHACKIAESLGVKVVSVPRYAGILSAVGIYLADVVVEGNEPVGRGVGISKGAEADSLMDEVGGYLDERFKRLCGELWEKLKMEEGGGGGGGGFKNVKFEKYLNIRYSGTDSALMIRGGGEASGGIGGNGGLKEFCNKFVVEYTRQFGFQLEKRELVIDDLRVRAVGSGGVGEDGALANGVGDGKDEKKEKREKPDTVVGHFDRVGRVENCKVYECDSDGDNVFQGPCLILDDLSTIVVEPGWKATVSKEDVKLEKIVVGGDGKSGSGCKDDKEVKLDSIVLSIFSHRFMSIAEQMGRILQRTSVSTNIKERLDFSCAIFGEDGGLVSNAPHIPVHLGAMQEAVQYQLRVGETCECKDCKNGKVSTGKNLDCLKLFPGDVILSNHPVAGGSHLPDLTVITPVFNESDNAGSGERKLPIFFVANRGHHADIGGITPGSMPPHSKTIHEEGAVFKSFKLVRGGTFMEEELIRELMRPGELNIEGSSGTRGLSDNLSDLRAQVAANQKGIGLLQSLIGEYSLKYVQGYMKFIQENAEVAVRDMLRSFVCGDDGKGELVASDFMDDGTEIKLSVKIDRENGNAVFDFTGTGWQVLGNCNAPKAITLSAVIYSLRSLVGRDIPLNQGCLKPVKIVIPEGSILAPSEDAAVVGGNVQTSQRVVDVILRAFGACAASQGCMNNVTFGNENMGYYETIAGGAGAGPTWEGRSGVHVHMTNTRITDPEIMEIRYPVILNHFSLEEGSGGKGKFRGGDGVRREIMFREAMKLSVLTERRVFRPYGMEGGGEGDRGKNLLLKGWWWEDERQGGGDKRKRSGIGDGRGRVINLGGKTSIDVDAGDLFVLISPGGGGWGKEEKNGI